MAAPTYTLATVTKNTDGTYTLGNRPTDAYALATVDAAGAKVPAPIANFGGGAGPATALAETVSLNVLQAKPGSGEVVANVQYACSSDLWNNAAGGTVWVLGLKTDAYWPVGIGTVNGTRQLVTIDVAAATYVPFAGGAALPTANVAVVPVAKRQQVVKDIAASIAAGGQAMVQETDLTLLEKHFKDPRIANAPYFYWCTQEVNPSTNAVEAWWNRFRIQ